MLVLLASLALAQQPPPPPTPAPAAEPADATGRPKIGVGFTYDLGFVPTDLTIGWAGQLFVAVGSVVGFSCFGGRAVLIPGSDDVVVGLEGTYCRTLSYQIDADSRSTGLFVGTRRKVDDGQYVSVQLGMGYSGGVVQDGNARWDGMYVRPRAAMTIERGPLAVDVGPFIQLPIFFTQRVEGDSIGTGMLTRIGLELTVYGGRFDG